MGGAGLEEKKAGRAAHLEKLLSVEQLDKAQLPQFELFHLPLSILAKTQSIRRAKLPAGKLCLVPPPPSSQTLALPPSQARTGKGREGKTTSKCSGAVFPLIRLSYLRLELCLEN